MLYEEIDAFMKESGLAREPAFDYLHILTCEIPPAPHSRILGLYFPDGDYGGHFGNLPPSTTVLPPDVSRSTLLHELGHRYGHYYFNDISEPFAEAFRMAQEKRLGGLMENIVMPQAQRSEVCAACLEMKEGRSKVCAFCDYGGKYSDTRTAKRIAVAQGAPSATTTVANGSLAYTFSGFRPITNMQAIIGNIVIDIPYADSNGSGAGTIPLSNYGIGPGSYTLVLANDYGDVATANFTVGSSQVPVITIDGPIHSGQSLTVRCSGFTPNGQIDFWAFSNHFGVVSVGPDGSVVVSIPDNDPAGYYELDAIDVATGNHASAPFTILGGGLPPGTPILNISNPTIPVGGTIQYTFMRCPPNSLFGIKLNGVSTGATASSDSNGAGYGSFKMDASMPPGTYTFMLYADLGNPVATASFTIQGAVMVAGRGTFDTPLLVPSDMTIAQDILYAAATTYTGPATGASVRFSISTLGISALDSLFQNTVARVITESTKYGEAPIELVIYSRPNSLLQGTDYFLNLIVTDHSATPSARVAMSAQGILIAAIVLIAVIGAVWIGINLSQKAKIEAETKLTIAQTKVTTRTTNDTTKTIDPGKDTLNPNPAGGPDWPVTAGSGGGVLTLKDGTQIPFKPGETSVIPPGATFHNNAPGSPATVIIPGGSLVTTEPPPAAKPTDWVQVAKYAAIGIGGIAGVALIVNLASMFKPPR